MQHLCSRHLTAGEAVRKLGRKPIDQDRDEAVQLRKRMAKSVASALRQLAPIVTEQLQASLGLEKKDRAGGNPEAIAEAGGRLGRALAAVQALEFGEWVETLVATVQPPLQDMAMSGAQAALQQLGLKADDLLPVLTDKTTAWAAERAAEMVGMRRLADGTLAPNPLAKWRIDDATREMVRKAVNEALEEGSSAAELAAKLEDSRAFSAERAEVIARTELARADMAGAMEGYRTSGLVAGKVWSTSKDDLVSEECRLCEAAGVVLLEQPFPTGVKAPPNHPNCRCSVLPVLDDEMPPQGKATKDANMTKLWADITKAEKQDDGTLKVWGFASAEVVDSDGEVITAEAMRAARDGYMAFANVREMHDPKKAAGVAIEYEVQDDGRTWFGAHVVDPVAVLKVETGVYKGFSIGARVPPGGREGKVIKSIDLREVSLVDRPANPEAVFTMFKADGAADDAAADSEGGTTDLKKGLYELRDFADALRCISYLASNAEFEAQVEGDGSPLPAALREWLAQGVALFKAMAEEETAEMLAQLQAQTKPMRDAAVISLADHQAELQKAGKRFSAATKAALAKIHGACKEATAHLDGLGYADEDADEDKGGEKADGAGAADDLQKADDLAKAAAAAEAEQITEIAKAAGLELAEPTTLALAKASLAELVDLRKKHAELLAQPAPAKGARMVVVEKADDRAGERTDNTPEPVVKADGAVDDVATLVKAAHGRPIRLV